MIKKHLLPHREKVDDKHQSFVRLDHATGAPSAIAEMRWDGERAAATDLHARNALVPARDDLACTQPEFERFHPIPGCIELLAGGPRDSNVMDHHVLARSHGGTVADNVINNDQFSGSKFLGDRNGRLRHGNARYRPSVVRSKAPSKKVAPTRHTEQELWSAGHQYVIGVDEVGRGAWAGPLVVGAALLPRGKRVNGVRDSKMLTEAEREQLFDRVAGWCEAWAVGAASRQECDDLGMAEAQRLAARRAVEGLGMSVDAAIVDGKWNFLAGIVPHTQMMVKADAYCLSVAAASILAKVSRDREMREMSQHFPPYSFETNKGYPCPTHKAALQGYGPCSEHRRSWVFMDGLAYTSARIWRAEQPTLF